MMPDSVSTTIDPAVLDLVALFQNELAELRFPDADARTLDAAIAAVSKQLDVVHELWTAHQDAVQLLRERQHALREHARKIHAYARVFATDDPELAQRLGAIALDEPASATPKKRRRRGRKTAVATPQLDLDGAPTAATEDRAPSNDAAGDAAGGRRATAA